MPSISATSSTGSVNPVELPQPDDAPGPTTGTGPYAPPSDGVDPPGAGDHLLFADGTSNTTTCPAGSTPKVIVDGQQVTVICQPNEGKKGNNPSPAPILE